MKLSIILYCSFVSFTYLYSPTNASFSDEETVTGTITVGHWEPECKDLKAKGEEQDTKLNNDEACGKDKEKEDKDKTKEKLSPSEQKADEGTNEEKDKEKNKEKDKPDTKKEEITKPEVPKKPEQPQKQPEEQPKESAEKPEGKADGDVQQNQPETESGEDTAVSAANKSLQSSDQ